MNRQQTLDLLRRVGSGDATPEDALEALRRAPYERMNAGVNIDHHRSLRTGLGEIVFGLGKSLEQLEAALRGLADAGPVLATKVAPEQGRELAERLPQGVFVEPARLFYMNCDLRLSEPWTDTGDVLVVTAGAADLPIGLEAYGCAQFFGLSAGLVTDVGVAGLHRVTPHLAAMERAKILIIAAGMEGALPSALGGMTSTPIVAVPTSVGYGASFEGLAALLGMLNSCAPGTAVVNIDNGFGAAAFAAKIMGQEQGEE